MALLLIKMIKSCTLCTWMVSITLRPPLPLEKACPVSIRRRLPGNRFRSGQSEE